MNQLFPVKLSSGALARRRGAGADDESARAPAAGALVAPSEHTSHYRAAIAGWGRSPGPPVGAADERPTGRRIILRRVTVFDPDQLSDIVPGANIEHRLLQSGRFEARALHVRTAMFTLDYLRYSAAVMLKGDLPASGTALAFGLRRPEEAVAFGVPQRAYALMQFDPAAGLHLRLPAGGEWAMFRLSPALLEAEAFRRSGGAPTEPAMEPRLLRVPGPQWRRVVRLMAMIERATESTGVRHDHAESQNLEALLFEAVIEAYTAARVPQSNDHGALARRRRLVSRAEEYVYAHIDDSVRMKRLCRDIGASARTLEYAFKGIYGFGVMESMRTLRLNEVRKKLLRAGPEQVTVTTAAMDWGFWHLGEFAAEYRRLFGELPSHTLRIRSTGPGLRNGLRDAVFAAHADGPDRQAAATAQPVAVTGM